MAVKKSYDTFAQLINNMNRLALEDKIESMKYNSIILGYDPQIYLGVNETSGKTRVYYVRDLEDGVVYFMVGIDRVGTIAKVGV